MLCGREMGMREEGEREKVEVMGEREREGRIE